MIFPGVSDGSYGLCRAKFEEAKKLLEDNQFAGRDLYRILNILDNNPSGVEFLKLKLGDEYDRVYSCLGQAVRLSMSRPTQATYVEFERWEGSNQRRRSASCGLSGSGWSSRFCGGF